MKIGHITPFYPHNSGICRYVDALVDGISQNNSAKQYLIGQRPCHRIENSKIEAREVYDHSGDYVDDIVQAASALCLDVATFQHTPDHFGLDNRLIETICKLKQKNIRTVVNLHSVYSPGKRCAFTPDKNVGAFDRALGENVSMIHLHTDLMKRRMVARGVAAEKIEVIPHGSLLVAPEDKNVSRKKLGIPVDSKVAMFFGFVWLGKGLDFLLSVWRDVAKLVPNAFFYVGGYTRAKNLINQTYMNYLKTKAKLFGLGDKIIWSDDFVPDALVPTLYGASDVVCLPYRQDYASVSGVAHQAIGRDTLLLCSDIAKFAEIKECVSEELVCTPKDKNAWVSKLSRILNDVDFAENMRQKTQKFAKETSWKNVGQMHLAMYQKVLSRA